MQGDRVMYTTVLMLAACVAATAASAASLVPNGAMEPPFHGGLAHGWVRNCYGRNTVATSQDAPHAGKASQKIACAAFESGAVQFYYPLKVKAGTLYTVSLWMRATGGIGTVGVGLRHCPAPYTMHLSAEFEPGETWEKFTFTRPSMTTDERAALFIWARPAGAGALWLDDVTVTEGTLEPLVLPAPTGNVVPNASFELALERHWRSRQRRARYDTREPFHGSRSLRWDLDDNADQLAMGLVEFGGNDKPFTLALAARAKGRARIHAELWPAMRVQGASPFLRLECQPQQEWKVFRKTAKLPSSPNGAYYFVLDVHAEGKATVWLDAVRLEPGDGAAAFRTCRPVEASLECPSLAHIHRQGRRPRLTVRAFNGSDQAREVALTCRVTDYWRRPVADLPVRLAIEPGAMASTRITLPVAKTGVYLAELLDGDEVLSALSFSVLPPVSRVPADRSAVGGHFRLDDFHLRVANAMGIKWTRIHDCESITHWRTVEPEPGRFQWADDKVRLARRRGVRILGEFLRVPKWASSAGPEVTGGEVHLHPPRDLREFAAYVRTTVAHYKHTIRHWEIWNEPYGSGFWRGTPEQYAELAKVAAREVRATDPDAVILAPCIHPNAHDWAERALAAGATTGADVFSYHGYEIFHTIGYRRMQEWAAHGRTRPLPIWNTETGETSRTFYRHLSDKLVNRYTNWLRPLDCGTAAEHCVKLFVLALAGGAERYFQYWCVYEDSLLPRLSAMTIFEYDTALRPMAVAYAVAASLLDGTRGRGWTEMPGSVLANLLEDDRRLVAVLWRAGGRRARTLAIPIDPAHVEIRSVMGNVLEPQPHGTGLKLAISGEPIYLVASVRHAASLRAALRNATRIAPGR